MVFEELATGVINFVKYGETILVILLIWEGFKFIGTFGGGAGKVANRMVDWKKSPVLNAIKRQKGRANTRLLNEYLEEQKETTLLDEAVKAAKEALAGVQTVLAAKQMTFVVRMQLFGKTASGKLGVVLDLGEKLKTAKQEYRRVNRNTWRQERSVGEIIKKMRAAGMDVKQLLALEANILKLHKECADELNTVLTHYAKMDAAIKAVRNEPQASFQPNGYRLVAGAALLPQMTAMGTNLKNVVYTLEDAYKKQLEVDKEVQGLISLGRRAWGGIK